MYCQYIVARRLILAFPPSWDGGNLAWRAHSCLNMILILLDVAGTRHGAGAGALCVGNEMVFPTNTVPLQVLPQRVAKITFFLHSLGELVDNKMVLVILGQ